MAAALIAFIACEQAVRPLLITHLLVFAVGVLQGATMKGAKAKRGLRHANGDSKKAE